MIGQRGLPAIALRRQLQAGQTLIEVLLAFSASILILSAIIIGITTSLANTQYTKNQNLANSYAQEAMATVRKVRNSGWPTFSSYVSNTTYCLGPSPANLTEALTASQCRQNDFLVGGIFAREIKLFHSVDDPSNNCSGGTKVTVKVSWADSKCPPGVDVPLCHDVELITCLSNIDQKVEP